MGNGSPVRQGFSFDGRLLAIAHHASWLCHDFIVQVRELLTVVPRNFAVRTYRDHRRRLHALHL
jgi:hypothetical protein